MKTILDALPDGLLALAAVLCGLALLPTREAIFAGILAVVVATIAAVDRRHFLIPDMAGLALAVGGLALAFVEAMPGEVWSAILDASARGLAAGLFFWGLRAAHRAWRGGEGLGLGDVELAAAGAPWLAWTTLVPVLELAVFGALVAVLIAAWRRGARPGLGEMVPFGAFLAPALWIGFLAERTGLVARLGFPGT